MALNADADSLPDAPLTLRSPSGRTEIALTWTAETPWCVVRFDGKPAIERLELGLLLSQGRALQAAPQQPDVTYSEQDEIYTQPAGKANPVRNRYRQMLVEFKENAPPHRCLNLEFRAYDDGAAFRYVLPQQEALTGRVEIVAEQTAFHFPENLRVWALQLPGFTTSFEGEYTDMALADWKPGDLATVPVTLQAQSGLAVAITEAALSDYAGMYLTSVEAGKSALKSVLSPLPEENGSGVCVRIDALPFASPWRVVLLGDTPGALIESNVVRNLNPPCALADSGWIRPGRVLWDWWSGSTVEPGDAEGNGFIGGMNDATMEHYIAFASEWGLEYMLIDGGWYGPSNSPEADITRSVPAIHLPHLISYARERGVDILLWMHWKDTLGHLDRAFAYYESLGVKGVKVDFFDRDDQEVVRYVRHLIETAARHHLLVDLHGIYKPTGLERTYPNLMTHEGVLGAEYNKWSARVTPRHNLTLPFTRMLAGPMDYTPGAFRNVTPQQFVARRRAPMAMGTRCHQLAMYVVYESGLQMISDYPNAYRGEPGAEFLKVVPTAWDETRVLEGAVGEWIVVARRRGADWFVGAMTSEGSRALTLPLAFLGEGEYEATIYSDGQGASRAPAELQITRQRVRRSETVSATLAPAGGWVARLSRSQ